MLAGYWPARKESLDECTMRTAEFISKIVKVRSQFSCWYKLGRTRKQALEQPVDIGNIKIIRNLLAAGRNRRDIDQEVIDELGYSLSVWNGGDRDENESNLSITCGVYSNFNRNSVLLKFQADLHAEEGDKEGLMLLTALAESWEPEWAGLMSRPAMRDRDFGASSSPFVDWMVYVPKVLPSPPRPSRLVETGRPGSIIVVQPDPPQVGDLEARSRIAAVENLIKGS
ncbi:Imm52 family immunity protein [Labrys sp. KB_33_2]|uniref:Imm52 family immunity protein n=1 Tax=Labrys sp. KB_33_2 TaxID=3237479 RepID=UPI003F8E82A0